MSEWISEWVRRSVCVSIGVSRCTCEFMRCVVHEYVRVYKRAYLCVHVYYTCMYIRVHSCVHVCVRVYIRVCVHLYRSKVWIQAHVRNMRALYARNVRAEAQSDVCIHAFPPLTLLRWRAWINQQAKRRSCVPRGGRASINQQSVTHKRIWLVCTHKWFSFMHRNSACCMLNGFF